MKNKFITTLASLMLMLTFTSLKADMNIGLSVMVGQLDTTGSETEKVDLANTPDVNNKSFEEQFYGASVFFEAVADNGLTLGIDYVPVDFDIGDGDKHLLINGMYPDAEDLQGGYNVTFTTQIRDARGTNERAYSSQNITNNRF